MTRDVKDNLIEKADWKKGEQRQLSDGKVCALLPVIVQHVSSGQVLMLGYFSRESLEKTLQAGQVVFFSRTKERLWKKGETSGNTLNLVDIKLDCDNDTFLAFVDPVGETCHRGCPTCFDSVTDPKEKQFEETHVGYSFFETLRHTISQRAGGDDQQSYTYKLLNAGVDRIAKKLGEEGTELILGAKNASLDDGDEFTEESADYLYHWLVMCEKLGVHPLDVVAALEKRFGAPRRTFRREV